MGEVHYMISEAAKRVNVETHVLRYWEDELTLPIERTEMGHRYYTEEDIQLFRCIKELKEQGMQLKELKGLIPDMVRTRTQLKLQKTKSDQTSSEPKMTTGISEEPVSDEKFEQVQTLIGEMLQNILLENNKLLEAAVSRNIVREIDFLLQAKDRQEEDRYKKLDHLIRQQQALRKEAACSTPVKKLRKLLEM